MANVRYLLRTLSRLFVAGAYRCPNCGSLGGGVVDTKVVITQLRRCRGCRLQFRTPTDRPGGAEVFYETRYAEGSTTDMPTRDRLEEEKLNGFPSIPTKYGLYIAALDLCDSIPRGARLFDFGCSWGYGSYQLARAGYRVLAYEIAPTRRRYAADNLGVETCSDLDALVADPASSGAFDVFFSAHVVEHLSRPREAFELARRLLKPGGVYVSITPNGGAGFRAIEPNWSKIWGEVHPSMIDDAFLDAEFAPWPRIFATLPVSEPFAPPPEGRRDLDDLAGAELLFVALKPSSNMDDRA